MNFVPGELQLRRHSYSLLLPSEVTLALTLKVLQRGPVWVHPFPSLLIWCLNTPTQFSKAARLHLALASQVWSPWRLPTYLVYPCPRAPRLLLSSPSPQPCPAPCWEARTDFRKRNMELCSGNFCFWPSNLPVLNRREQQRGRHCVGKGSGEGMLWG